MSMTLAELLQKYPLPWRVTEYVRGKIKIHDDNSVNILPCANKCLAHLIVACVNTVGQYANPEGVGELVWVCGEMFKGRGNILQIRDALAALDQEPTPKGDD